MTGAIAWATFVVGVLAFAAAWLALMLADRRVDEAERKLWRASHDLERAHDIRMQVAEMLRDVRTATSWAERYEFGAAMRAAETLRQTEGRS